MFHTVLYVKSAKPTNEMLCNRPFQETLGYSRSKWSSIMPQGSELVPICLGPDPLSSPGAHTERHLLREQALLRKYQKIQKNPQLPIHSLSNGVVRNRLRSRVPVNPKTYPKTFFPLWNAWEINGKKGHQNRLITNWNPQTDPQASTYPAKIECTQ